MWLFSILVVIWFILSGYFTILPVVPGLIFIAISVVLYRKLKKDADLDLSFSVKMGKFLFYIPYMIKEIFVSNIEVAKVILKNNLEPVFFRIPNTFTTHSGITIFANSVTLTPGTIVLVVTEDFFIIHSLVKAGKEGVLSHDMYNKVLELEKQNPSNKTEEVETSEN